MCKLYDKFKLYVLFYLIFLRNAIFFTVHIIVFILALILKHTNKKTYVIKWKSLLSSKLQWYLWKLIEVFNLKNPVYLNTESRFVIFIANKQGKMRTWSTNKIKKRGCTFVCHIYLFRFFYSYVTLLSLKQNIFVCIIWKKFISQVCHIIW